MTDPLEINPKERFRRSLKRPEEYRALVSQPMIQEACQGVLAHMAIARHSREQLDGAIAFVHLFLNFSEEAQQKTSMPIRKLNVTEHPNPPSS